LNPELAGALVAVPLPLEVTDPVRAEVMAMVPDRIELATDWMELAAALDAPVERVTMAVDEPPVRIPGGQSISCRLGKTCRRETHQRSR